MRALITDTNVPEFRKQLQLPLNISDTNNDDSNYSTVVLLQVRRGVQFSRRFREGESH